MFKNALARSVLALVLLVGFLVSFGTNALALPSPPAAPLTPPSLVVPPEPAPPPGNGPEDCKGDEVCIAGWRTYVVKKAIREFLDVLTHNAPRIIRAIENAPIPDSWKRHLRTNLPLVSGVLNQLLLWEDLVFDTIRYQLTNAAIAMGIGPRIADWIGRGAQWIIEWGLF